MKKAALLLIILVALTFAGCNFESYSDHGPPPPPPPSTDDTSKINDGLAYNDTLAKYNTGNKADKSGTYTFVDQMPQFPGGEVKLVKYLADNVHYPQMAKDAGSQGTVYVSFLINETGKIDSAYVQNSTVKGAGKSVCNAEAIRVVKTMPDWKPGKEKGKAVKVWYKLPIRYTLK